MSKNLILIISIFVFWLFIYLNNVKEQKQAESALQRTKEERKERGLGNGLTPAQNTRREREERGLGDGLKHSYITSPVKAKGAN